MAYDIFNIHQKLSIIALVFQPEYYGLSLERNLDNEDFSNGIRHQKRKK